MKVVCVLPWFLSAILVGNVVFQIIIPPAYATSEPADYMYDLDEDGLGDEGGIDFGSPLEPLTFTSYNHTHNHNDGNTSSKSTASPVSAEMATFGVQLGSDDHLKGKSGVTDGGEGRIINVSIMSNDKNDKRFQSKLSRTGDHVFGGLLVVFCFLSLVGNSCTLLVFCFRHRRLSPAEVFLVNLGIVDILLSCASYPMSMMASFKHRWDFGELGCTMYAFICYFLGVASIISVTSIALIRYLKTCTPAQGNQITCWTSCKMIAYGYVVALIWAALPLVGFGNYGFEPYGLSCTLDWVAKDDASRIYIFLVTIFCVFLPLFIIIFCYSRIIILVKQSDALMQGNGVTKRNMKGPDIQLTWISGLVTAGFIGSWCPYSITSLWASFRGEVMLPMWATPIPVLMAKSSIAFNPFIYIFFTARYREDFFNLVHYWFYSHTKGNRQGKDNNSGALDRSPFKRSARAKSNEYGNGNDSPGYSGSSSLTTRQLTTTTCVSASVNNGTAVIPSTGAIQLRNLGNSNNDNTCNNNYANNINNNDENGHFNELNELDDEYDEDDQYDHNSQRETRILIVREEACSHQHYRPIIHVPSHAITTFTGNGTSTVVAPTRLASHKIISASSSLFSLRSSGCSSLEEEQQV